ncbi:MAG: ribosome assembly factor SBDS [Candidatus Woesearchaeota archaeon]
MVDVDKAVIAKLKKEGKNFEILVDCDKALELRKGKSVGMDDVLATDDVFKDVKKGEKASEHDLQSLFGTTDVREVSKKIILDGVVQLTREHLAREREEKRKQIVNIIHRNAIDPKTGLPHPPQRIENAMEEAKVHIDENKRAEDQVEDILNKIKPIIPIKFEKKKLQVIIPPKYAGQTFHVFKSYGEHKEEWLGDGSLRVKIELPAGIVDEFFGKLNSICRGEVESKEL